VHLKDKILPEEQVLHVALQVSLLLLVFLSYLCFSACGFGNSCFWKAVLGKVSAGPIAGIWGKGRKKGEDRSIK